MKVGDLVRRKDVKELRFLAKEFGVDGVGIIINFPDNMGAVVDIMTNGKTVRYWIEGIERVSRAIDHEIETISMSFADSI